ncbi:hypothetical protein DAI22_05g073900 [Oryza sativa Japonica Group]|nr:hypothetical protein DAI22_05g073900 [Oryza sativa Japonica Group]
MFHFERSVCCGLLHGCTPVHISGKMIFALVLAFSTPTIGNLKTTLHQGISIL